MRVDGGHAFYLLAMQCQVVVWVSTPSIGVLRLLLEVFFFFVMSEPGRYTFSPPLSGLNSLGKPCSPRISRPIQSLAYRVNITIPSSEICHLLALLVHICFGNETAAAGLILHQTT